MPDFKLGHYQMMPTLAIIPVIIVSARDGVGNQKRALDAGAKAFL
jgi:hypothetical protein